MKNESYEVWKIDIPTGEKEPDFATLDRAEAEQRFAKRNDDRTPEEKCKFRFEFLEDSTHPIAFYSAGGLPFCMSKFPN
jgi:hypothetical protein